jgi:hypothetical protein
MHALFIFIDESADDTKSRVFALAGAIGTESEWRRAEAAWVARTGGTEFHAAECESIHARSSDQEARQQNLDVYRDLTQILAKSQLAGVAVALDLAAHRELFGPDVPADVGYYKCFSDLLHTLGDMARQFNATQGEAVTLDFTLDHRKESAGNAGSLYSAFTNQPEWAQSPIFGGPIKFDSRANPRIQMADLLARETMKEFERIVSGAQRPVRRSMECLIDTDKFRFLYRDRAYCEFWRGQMEQLQRESGLTIAGYGNWLADMGRVQNGHRHDNWRNRFEYLAWLDRQARQNGN